MVPSVKGFQKYIIWNKCVDVVVLIFAAEVCPLFSPCGGETPSESAVSSTECREAPGKLSPIQHCKYTQTDVTEVQCMMIMGSNRSKLYKMIPAILIFLSTRTGFTLPCPVIYKYIIYPHCSSAWTSVCRCVRWTITHSLWKDQWSFPSITLSHVSIVTQRNCR